MKLITLQSQFENRIYELDLFFGVLLEHKMEIISRDIKLPDKVGKSLFHCANPYTLTTDREFDCFKGNFYKKNDFLDFYIWMLITMNKLSLNLGRLITYFGKTSFKNTAQAINYFRSNKKGSIQNDLCLSRTFFAASTSESFKEKGVIFIGISLPSRLMHSWIIEDSVQPDQFDDIWINFTPVAALYYE